MKTMWTALISAIVAFLAMLGIAAPASATAAPADRSSDAPQPAPAAAERTDSPAGRAGRTAVAPTASRSQTEVPTRSVPPTMKQRISAEAHGGSPSVRTVPALDTLDGPGAPTGALPDEAAAKAATRGAAGSAARAHLAAV